ncbi:MAG: hypothetical protein Q4C73_08160 [Eubacteriales bacterium]|nr:hypothetical protein [Eubacteriales bacterium]
MKFSKRIVSLMLAAMMVMAMSLTAFAAPSVKMYGYMNGEYKESNHTAAFIGSVVDEGDGEYTIQFVKAKVYGQEGYIASMTINGTTFTANPLTGAMTVNFDYNPTVEVTDGVYGQAISYAVNVSDSTHPNSTGALVIQ